MAGIKLPIEKVRKRMVSFRCSDDEHKRVQRAASTADVPLSDWVRDTVLEAAEATPPKMGRAAKWVAGGDPVVPEPTVLVSEGSPWMQPDQINEPPKPEYVIEPPGLLPHVDLDELPLTWADHWTAMERMDPGEATARLYELAAGRPFPDGFPRWPKARKIEWLEATWPL